MDEFDGIFSKVPRVTVEVLISCGGRGVLLALRDVDPCRGMWNLPGGSARFGEPLVEAVRRVAADELGIRVRVGPLVGYIEYPWRVRSPSRLISFRRTPWRRNVSSGRSGP
ncbi:MAG: NUDIX hydrolase [Solirubrobacteraceae bacterium]